MRNVTARRLSELCEVLTQHGFPARLEGEDRTVYGVNTLENATEGEVSFLSNPKYHQAMRDTKATAVILKDGIEVPRGLAALRCDDPYAGVTVSIVALHGYRKHPTWGKSDKAAVHASARIGANANIAPGVTIEADVIVGDNCTFYPGVYIADGVRIGDECTLFPNVVIYDDCVLGNRVTVHAGSVIGEDGLGYAPSDEKWIKIPQVGRAIVGDDVEIGANCTIDRATLGQTEIGSGTKLGNVVLIGHGATIGNDCLLVGHVAVAGSANIGCHVTLAGMVGVGGHLTIGDGSSVGGGSHVYGDVAPGSKLLGAPARPIMESHRSTIAMRQLPDWIRRIKALEAEIEELRRRVDTRGNG